jgi:hypothetical protein
LFSTPNDLPNWELDHAPLKLQAMRSLPIREIIATQ